MIEPGASRSCRRMNRYIGILTALRNSIYLKPLSVEYVSNQITRLYQFMDTASSGAYIPTRFRDSFAKWKRGAKALLIAEWEDVYAYRQARNTVLTIAIRLLDEHIAWLTLNHKEEVDALRRAQKWKRLIDYDGCDVLTSGAELAYYFMLSEYYAPNTVGYCTKESVRAFLTTKKPHGMGIRPQCVTPQLIDVVANSIIEQRTNVPLKPWRITFTDDATSKDEEL